MQTAKVAEVLVSDAPDQIITEVVAHEIPALIAVRRNDPTKVKFIRRLPDFEYETPEKEWERLLGKYGQAPMDVAFPHGELQFAALLNGRQSDQLMEALERRAKQSAMSTALTSEELVPMLRAITGEEPPEGMADSRLKAGVVEALHVAFEADSRRPPSMDTDDEIRAAVREWELVFGSKIKQPKRPKRQTRQPEPSAEGTPPDEGGYLNVSELTHMAKTLGQPKGSDERRDPLRARVERMVLQGFEDKGAAPPLTDSDRDLAVAYNSLLTL